MPDIQRVDAFCFSLPPTRTDEIHPNNSRHRHRRSDLRHRLLPPIRFVVAEASGPTSVQIWATCISETNEQYYLAIDDDGRS